MSFFISNAIAASTAAPSGQSEGAFPLLMIVAIFVLFYFMLIRPQNKRAKEHREMVKALKKGDEIVTTGGMLGKVISLDEQFIKISLAEGIEINLQRNAVSTVLPKGTMKSL
ncbi:preprotein translocase subunit YajC [Legionella spiritensis]|uniref:Sec translocon accessory complex subunit YajC n=1 Tax=Legionella spiritensis TaxID=452 RepID=A0A0W0Z9B8_LEGSP|nr:preprotein translocase subunit YajC [Legionella spiritensis]KTD65707.1 SecYEG protein translocase auxillary subunit [Legionella spiritensis]SNV43372.1 SecYEG protein translocase auxillary subunit [Legionella spiritensis]VEG90633.1 SecYEG protein translocase auxillary subunit [Legionella spiritensis]